MVGREGELLVVPGGVGTCAAQSPQAIAMRPASARAPRAAHARMLAHLRAKRRRPQFRPAPRAPFGDLPSTATLCARRAVPVWDAVGGGAGGLGGERAPLAAHASARARRPMARGLGITWRTGVQDAPSFHLHNRMAPAIRPRLKPRIAGHLSTRHVAWPFKRKIAPPKLLPPRYELAEVASDSASTRHTHSATTQIPRLSVEMVRNMGPRRCGRQHMLFVDSVARGLEGPRRNPRTQGLSASDPRTRGRWMVAQWGP